MPLATLLADSDWVVPQLPTSDATRAFIGRAQFARMKPGAFLVNISRADIVDRAAAGSNTDAAPVSLDRR